MAEKRANLRAVAPDEKPASKKKPATIKAAVEASERELLVAMRTKIAAEIDTGVPAHTLPKLMQQLREFDQDIRAIDARGAGESNEERDDERTVADEAFDPATSI